jgi:hypothetical protein
MANKEIVALQIKADTKEATQNLENVTKQTKNISDETKGAIGNFQVMGVSLNGVKGAFSKIIPTAKAMFGSIKAGLISTGIGAFVVVIASLFSYFTNTQRGADKLEIALKSVGTAVDVIKDRISSFGEAVTKFFQGDFKGAVETAKQSVVGIGKEISNEVSAIQEITKGVQKLRDVEREFSVERAKTNQEIAKARLLAEDENLTIEDRIKHLETANKLELETTDEAIRLAEEKLRLKREEVALGESLNEDFDELAQLEVDLITLQTNSFNTRKRLATGIETLRTEAEAEDKRIAAEQQKQRDEDAKAELDLAKKKLDIKNQIALLEEENNKEREILKLEQDAEKLLAEEEDAEARRLINERLQLQIKQTNEKFAAEEEALSDRVKEKKKADDKAVADSKAQVGMQALGVMSDIVGRESAAGKSLAIAQSTINTYQAATNALANTPAPPPFPQIAAGVTVAAGLMQVRKIMATPPPEKLAQGGIVQGRGSGTSDSINARLSRGESVINAKSTRMFRPMLSAINEAGGGRGFADGGMIGGASGGITTGTVKAFVVADEMTNEQDRLNNIRRKATI